MQDLIIIGVIAVLVIVGINSMVKHFRGEGGCCGGSSKKPVKKKLTGPKIGEKTVIIEGMHCDNCKNSVENAINKLEGAVCKVNLNKKKAVISYSQEITDDVIRQAIETLDFKVVDIVKNIN